jgi:hypothetical protein
MHEFSAVRDGYALPREASVLGDVLGQMSFDNVREYPWNLLTNEQARLLGAFLMKPLRTRCSISTFELRNQFLDHMRVERPLSIL